MSKSTITRFFKNGGGRPLSDATMQKIVIALPAMAAGGKPIRSGAAAAHSLPALPLAGDATAASAPTIGEGWSTYTLHSNALACINLHAGDVLWLDATHPPQMGDYVLIRAQSTHGTLLLARLFNPPFLLAMGHNLPGKSAYILGADDVSILGSIRAATRFL